MKASTIKDLILLKTNLKKEIRAKQDLLTSVEKTLDVLYALNDSSDADYNVKLCKNCGEPFKPTGARQIYCSEKCGLKPKSEKEKIKQQEKKP